MIPALKGALMLVSARDHGEVAELAKRKMTGKQRLFVAEYLIDQNSTQAAIRAGYSQRNADKIGPELLGKARVAEAINEGMALKEKRTGITADKVLTELAKIAFGDLRGIMEWTAEGMRLRPSADLSDDEAALVAEISETTTQYGNNVKVKTNDKLKALELIGRHIGMYDKNNRLELVLPSDGEDLEGRRIARRLILEEVREARQGGGDSPDGEK